MVYIVMNNGCYGLTKGQDSATADFGSISKAGGVENPYQAIDLCGLALELGASFVGRSFSGDKNQLVPMIKAGMAHPGLAMRNGPFSARFSTRYVIKAITCTVLPNPAIPRLCQLLASMVRTTAAGALAAATERSIDKKCLSARHSTIDEAAYPSHLRGCR